MFIVSRKYGSLGNVNNGIYVETVQMPIEIQKKFKNIHYY